MENPARPEIKTRWLKLKPASSRSLSDCIREGEPSLFEPAHLLVIKGSKPWAVISVIQEVIHKALEKEGDPDLPLIDTTVFDPSGSHSHFRHSNVDILNLEEHVKRPELGSRFGVVIFSKLEVVPIEEYERSLEEVIKRANIKLAAIPLGEITSFRNPQLFDWAKKLKGLNLNPDEPDLK